MPQRLPQIITQEEFEKLFSAEKKKEYRLAYLLGFEAGMRISEIVGLKGADGSFIINPLSKSQVDLQGHTIKVIGGKGKKDRIVPLPKRFNENALGLLPLQFGRRVLQWRIKKLSSKILNKPIHFHTLRHGFGTHLAQTRPIHEVQALMGHSRLDTTGIYLHTNPVKAVEGARDSF
jgi:integrase/recombinase XerD